MSKVDEFEHYRLDNAPEWVVPILTFLAVVGSALIVLLFVAGTNSGDVTFVTGSDQEQASRLRDISGVHDAKHRLAPVAESQPTPQPASLANFQPEARAAQEDPAARNRHVRRPVQNRRVDKFSIKGQ
jgi:hypothetical protein